jgi:4-amino-4-deoxy-L-arabinose transferase-like glycosyltransferase
MKQDVAFFGSPLSSRQRVALVLLLAVAFALRVHCLWNTELWWDEFLTVHRARLPLGQLWHSLNTQAAFEASVDTSPPLHHSIIHFFLLLGNHEATVKLASVLFGTASIGMAFAVGSRCFGRLSGFLGAGYLCLLQYHIAYSRDLRWYSFFFFFSLASLYAFTRCVSPGRRRDAALWVVASGAMLYTSYVAAPYLLGQAVFAAYVVVSWSRDGRRAEALRFIKTMAVASAALIVLYLPQVPGQLVTMRVFYVPGLNPSSPSVLVDAWVRFAGFWHDQAAYSAAAAFVVGLLGGVAAWRRGRAPAVALLLLWGGVPTCLAFLINVQAQAQAKYFPGLLLLMALFAGAGLCFLAEAAARRLGGRPGMAALAGLGGVMALAWPNLDYSGLYRTPQPTSSQWAAFLKADGAGGEPLVLERNRQRKAILDWYFAGKTPWLSRAFFPGYHRFVYMGGRPEVPEGLPVVKILHQDSEMATFARGEVLSQSPIALIPDAGGQARFREDFTGFSLWRHAAALDNLAPDFTTGTLALVGFDAPGSVVYTFANPTGGRIETAVLLLQALLRDPIAGYAPDASAVIEACADGLPWEPLEEVSFETFLRHNPGMSVQVPLRPAVATLAVAVPPKLLEHPRFSVRLTIRPGGYGASIELAELSLEAGFAPQSAAPAVDPALVRCRTLAHNAPLRTPVPGVVPLEGQYLYGFGPQAEAIDPRLGTPSQMQAYAAANPGEPVVRVTRPDGSEVCRFYDPGRSGTEVFLETGKPVAVSVEAPVPAAIRGLRLHGELAEPVIRIGREQIALGLSLPRGSTAAVNPGGKGLVTFLQSFSAPTPPVDNMIRHFGLAEKTSGRSLTCRAGETCEFVYLFASRLPITGFRLTATPSVSPDGGQYVRAFYALNEAGDRREVFAYLGEGSGHWDTYANLTRQVTLPRPGHLLYVGFSLSGDGASVNGTDTYPLRIEVDLDARRLETPAFPEEAFTLEDVSAYPNAYRLRLFRDKLDF